MALENALHKLKRNQFNFEASRDNLQGPNTLSRLRGDTLRSNPEVGYDPTKGPGTPGEKRVPNVKPLQPTAPSAPSGQTDTGSSAMGNIMQLASLFKGQSTGTIPGQQPGTDFNMGAVNSPEAGRTAMPTGNKMDPYLLATILGSAGQAIGGRDTWQSRLGGNMAQIASKLYGEKSARDYEAPDKALDRRLKTAQAIKAETPETPEIPNKWEAFYSENKDKMSSTEMIKKYNKMEETEKNKTSVQDIRQYEQDRGKQIDDTRSFYHEMSRHLLDDMGYIKPGPKDDPGKYEREYNDIATKMSKDMNRINKGELPIWYSGKTGKSEKTITQTGTYNGRKVVKYSDGSIKYAD